MSTPNTAPSPYRRPPSSSPQREEATPNPSPWTSPATQLTPNSSNSSSDDSKEPGAIDIHTGDLDGLQRYEHDEHAGQSSISPYSQRLEFEDDDEKDEHRDSHLPEFSQSYTPEEERIVVKKFDRRLVLFVALLYMLSFLDRSNIGNAKIAGLEQDLHLTSPQYEWLLTAFYITYILFEWMTLMYRLVPAHIYISICVFSWGVLASLQSLATSFWSLVILRALLGISEAAFGPGVPYYLSFFFKREELAFRTGLFISAAPLATSFASSLAWVIVKLSKNGPLAPWRALFLAEGFPSVAVALFAWFYIPDSPGKAKYLNPRERKVAKLRLVGEQGPERRDQHGERMNWKEIGRAVRDPKCYLTAFMFFSSNVAFSSLPVFLPTIIRDMGYPAITSQALSAPPYLFAFVVVLLTSYLSDHLRCRSFFIIFHSILAASGYTLLCVSGLLQLSAPYRYLGIYPATAGFFSAITIIITWTVNNQQSSEGKGTGMAILNIIGQLGPLVGVRLFPDTDAPFYVKGMGVCAGFMLGVGFLAAGLRWWLGRENGRMEVKEKEEGWEMGGGGEDGEGLMGRKRGKIRDTFRYIL